MEYIGLNRAQQVYTEKNLLYCEMELLQTIKRYQLYKKLRKEELALKTLLRKKFAQIKDHIKILDSNLPHVRHKFIEPSLHPRPSTHSTKKREQLDDQIDSIRRRIAALN